MRTFRLIVDIIAIVMVFLMAIVIYVEDYRIQTLTTQINDNARDIITTNDRIDDLISKTDTIVVRIDNNKQIKLHKTDK